LIKTEIAKTGIEELKFNRERVAVEVMKLVRTATMNWSIWHGQGSVMQLRQVRDIEYQLLPGSDRQTTDIVIERDGVITVRLQADVT
jgi:hypothetical protein